MKKDLKTFTWKTKKSRKDARVDLKGDALRSWKLKGNCIEGFA
jgi:hypothetical protein